MAEAALAGSKQRSNKKQSAPTPAQGNLFELIAVLQSSATVPMIDIRAYARWLAQ